MANIRDMTHDDINAVLALGASLVLESPNFRTKTFDKAKCDKLLRVMLSSDLHGMFVAEEGGSLVGVALMYVTEQLFGPDKYASDILIYVTPEHRGGPTAFKFIKKIEQWASETGVPEITFGIGTGIHLDKTVRMYEKMGYKVTGTSLTKVIT